VWLWLNEKKIFLIPLSHTHTKIRKKKRQDTKKKRNKKKKHENSCLSSAQQSLAPIIE
jgi:hypothetical protein